MAKQFCVFIIAMLLIACDSKTVVHTDYNINLCKNLTFNAVYKAAEKNHKLAGFNSNMRDVVLAVAGDVCAQTIENTLYEPEKYIFIREKDKYVHEKADNGSLLKVTEELPAVIDLAKTYGNMLALKNKDDARIFAEKANKIP